MDLALLKRLLPAVPPGELDALYAAFVREGGVADVDSFAVHLHRSGRIGDDDLKAVESRTGIELTRYGERAGSGCAEGDRAAGAAARRLPGYLALEQIGAGSMGSILLVKDEDLRRKVAYKHIHDDMAADRSVVDRFYTEAQLTAQLEHPNIVPIYDLVVEEGGNLGYAMKLVHGRTLAALVAEAQGQWDDDGRTDERHGLGLLLEHFLKVCDAVHYANRKGVIHRDLKPQNIMVGADNEVYVMDWGIAKVVGAADESVHAPLVLAAGESEDMMVVRTRVGELLGTPMYMSPEQAAGRSDALDARSDQYALGAILFELVTLRRPYGVGRLEDLLPRVRAARLDPFVPHSRRQRVPAELKAIVRKACALEPANRYPDVEAFAAEIRRYLQGEAVQALPDTALRRLMRWMAKNREHTLLAVAGVLLASILAVSWSVYRHQQQEIAAQAREQQLAAFLTVVGQQAHVIDNQFLRFETLLAGLAASATNLLVHGRTKAGRYYSRADFAAPARRPPDYVHSDVYGQAVSTSWPLVKLAPGVEEAAVAPLIERLIPLRHYFRHIFDQSHPGSEAGAIGNRELPLLWSYVGLEQGVLLVFPGVDGYPEAYDPRQRPWYREALGHAGPVWTRPYVDVGGLGWMLPCTTPLHDEQGRLVGVAGVEMRLDYVRHHLLHLSAMPAVETVYLVDGEGRIVARSTDGETASPAAGTLINTIAELPVYPDAEVVGRIRGGASGDLLRDTGDTMTAYYRIESIGWYLVVEAAAGDLTWNPVSVGVP